MEITKKSIATLAKAEHNSLKGTRWAISYAEAYKEVLDKIFVPCVWPGGYPTMFLYEGAVLCSACAKNEFLSVMKKSDLHAMTSDIYYEGIPYPCEECNIEIESAYGNPEEE